MIVGSVPAKVGHRQTLINSNAPQGALLFVPTRVAVSARHVQPLDLIAKVVIIR